MTSIGEMLRREREKRNLDLDQVSRELKISTRFLEAIETENFDRLPGGVFAKSFVRQYARMFDLDVDLGRSARWRDDVRGHVSFVVAGRRAAAGGARGRVRPHKPHGRRVAEGKIGELTDDVVHAHLSV